jgi:hypothetical protein
MEAIKSLSKNVKESLHRKKLLQKIEEVYARIEALIDDVIPSFVWETSECLL